jgi:hypothetical protein
MRFSIRDAAPFVSCERDGNDVAWVKQNESIPPASKGQQCSVHYYTLEEHLHWLYFLDSLVELSDYSTLSFASRLALMIVAINTLITDLVQHSLVYHQWPAQRYTFAQSGYLL